MHGSFVVMYDFPMSEWTPREARKWLDPIDVKHIANRVRHQVCQCCGYDRVEQMECGHYRCELCANRDHFCLACALAV